MRTRVLNCQFITPPVIDSKLTPQVPLLFQPPDFIPDYTPPSMDPLFGGTSMSFAQLEPMYRSSVIPSSSAINITESSVPTKEEVIVRVAKLEILKSDLSSLKGNNW